MERIDVISLETEINESMKELLKSCRGDIFSLLIREFDSELIKDKDSIEIILQYNWIKSYAKECKMNLSELYGLVDIVDAVKIRDRSDFKKKYLTVLVPDTVDLIANALYDSFMHDHIIDDTENQSIKLFLQGLQTYYKDEFDGSDFTEKASILVRLKRILGKLEEMPMSDQNKTLITNTLQQISSR